MSSVLLSPHNDDETLFAAYTCLREHPYVIVVFKSVKQASPGYPGGPIKAETREAETACAMGVLGCSWEQLAFPDEGGYDQGELYEFIGELAQEFDHCYAPAVEEGGHPQHNDVGFLAKHAFRGRVTHYLTYTGGRERSRWGRYVWHSHGDEMRKRLALDCYASQRASPACEHHFSNEHVLAECYTFVQPKVMA